MIRSFFCYFCGLALSLCMPAFTVASPAIAVPWNGHSGAVSFTFDDGCTSQRQNVIPSLKERGIHATFFLITGNALFTGNTSTWLAAAEDGNEIASHTVSHSSLSGQSELTVDTEMSHSVAALEALDTSIRVSSMAYPYCATTAAVDSVVNRYAIIARTCGGTALFPWTSSPSSWMEMTSKIIQDSASAAAAMQSLDAAASAGSWLVTLNHGVGGDWLSVPASTVDSLFDRAMADSLWIAPYGTVAAYWRAAKVMDTVTAVSSADGWSLAWVSPHARMPRSVLLRLRLDTAIFGSAFTVRQNGEVLSPEPDGSYVIDFMKLSLQVNHKTAGMTVRRPAAGFVSRTAEGFCLHDLSAGNYSWSWRDLLGREGDRGSFAAEGTAIQVRTSTAGTGFLVLRTPSGERQVFLLPAF